MMLGCQFCQTNYVRRAILFLQFLHILNNILSLCHGSSSHYIISRAKHVLCLGGMIFLKLIQVIKSHLNDFAGSLSLASKKKINKEDSSWNQSLTESWPHKRRKYDWYTYGWSDGSSMNCWFPAIVSPLLSFSHICHHCPEALPHWRKN